MGIEYFEFMDTFYCEAEDEIGKVVKQNGEKLWFYEKTTRMKILWLEDLN